MGVATEQDDDMAGSRIRVSDSDRLFFTVFVALVLHTMLVLGISFSKEDSARPAQTLDITLASFEDQVAPDKADYLAQSHQQGSGTLEEKAELTAATPQILPDEVLQEALPLPEVKASTPAPKMPNAVVVTEARARIRTPDVVEEAPPTPSVDESSQQTLLERSLEIASLEARLDDQQRNYAKRPRTLRVTSMSTLASADAAYVTGWIRHVTKIGNLNFPDEARRQGLSGTLRVSVSIYSNGTIKDVQLLESSGHTLLDDAAIRIVRLAAPFPPFPDAMRTDKDVLEIIRTWSFEPRGLTSG